MKTIANFLLTLLLISATNSAMPLIQYDQFDQVLELFQFFHDINDGYFVDIGGYDPMKYSNTLHFYSKGWTGVSLQPNPKRWNNLQTLRSDDVNLNLAIGTNLSYTTLYDVVGTEAMSTTNPTVKQGYDKINLNISRIDVPTISMKQLCERFFRRKPEYLNLDVQGFSSQALLSNDWNNSKCRPDIITSQTNHQFNQTKVQPPRKILQARGYVFHSIRQLSEVYIEGSLYKMYEQKYKQGHQILAKTKVYKYYDITFPLAFHYGTKGYKLGSYEDTYYYFIKENTRVFLQDINSRSNTDPTAPKNRPILILSYNPTNTIFLLTQDSLKSSQKVQIGNLTFTHLKIQKKDQTIFEVIVFSDEVTIEYLSQDCEGGQFGGTSVEDNQRIERKINLVWGLFLGFVVVWVAVVLSGRGSRKGRGREARGGFVGEEIQNKFEKSGGEIGEI